MRIPIYTSGSNPAVDPPILRKKLSYVDSLIATRQARWVTVGIPKAGVMLQVSVQAISDSHLANIARVAGSGFNTAWAKKQSGYGGPLVWQLKNAK